MKSSNWAIGESVVVKPGVTDPDTGRDIGGWQGPFFMFVMVASTILL